MKTNNNEGSRKIVLTQNQLDDMTNLEFLDLGASAPMQALQTYSFFGPILKNAAKTHLQFIQALVVLEKNNVTLRYGAMGDKDEDDEITPRYSVLAGFNDLDEIVFVEVLPYDLDIPEYLEMINAPIHPMSFEQMCEAMKYHLNDVDDEDEDEGNWVASE